MKIDLLMVDTFEDSELELEKKLHLFLVNSSLTVQCNKIFNFWKLEELLW